ncbi:unnamed protein product [Lactuca virosa]|uniref:Uncharacterized protein n=1 Tax=Lactuca virosa TaxID=75947 RepID=A0AAU9MBK9_9ASTR|nr:unnamed protein product [Lactuca virosa]
MLISIISVSGSVMSLYKFPEHIGKMMRSWLIYRLNATNSTGLQAATRSFHPSFTTFVQTGVPDNEKNNPDTHPSSDDNNTLERFQIKGTSGK